MVKLEVYHDVQDPNAYLPAFLRLSGATGSWRIEGHTGQGGVVVHLLGNVRYDLLAIPDSGAAPDSIEFDPGGSSALTLTTGVPVEGTVAGPDGAPAAGVRVVMRAGSRPSTVG